MVRRGVVAHGVARDEGLPGTGGFGAELVEEDVPGEGLGEGADDARIPRIRCHSAVEASHRIERLAGLLSHVPVRPGADLRGEGLCKGPSSRSFFIRRAVGEVASSCMSMLVLMEWPLAAVIISLSGRPGRASTRRRST